MKEKEPALCKCGKLIRCWTCGEIHLHEFLCDLWEVKCEKFEVNDG